MHIDRRQIGLSALAIGLLGIVPAFADSADEAALAKKVDDSRAEGVGFGIDATPAFFIEGRPYFLHRSVDGFELRMRMDAARATSSCR